MRNASRAFWRVVTGLTALLFAVFWLPAYASGEDAPARLRVAFPETVGISETDAFGNRKGLLVDYLNEIAKYTGWEYEYVPVDTEDLVEAAIAGKFDLMGATFYDPSFEQFFAYPTYNMGYSRAVLLARRDDNRLRSFDLNSLNGKTIGVYSQAKEKIRRLEEFLRSNALDCRLQPYGPNDLIDGNLYHFLRGGQVDMLLGNALESDGDFRVVTSFDAQPYYIVTRPDRQDLLESLNAALERILDADPNFAETHYTNHFPNNRRADPQLSEGERAYIAAQGSVTVAVVQDWHPFYCADSAPDAHQGLLPDLLDRLSAFSGLRFELVPTGTYGQALELVKSGRADLLGVYLDSDESAFDAGMALTKPYIQLNSIVVKNKQADFPGEGLAGGILSNREMPSDIAAETVRYFGSSLEGIEAVNRGEIDFFYGLSAYLDREMQRHRFINVVPVTLVNNTTDISFALDRPTDTTLLTILNKSINSLSSQETNTILNRNLVSMAYTTLSPSDLLYANPVASLLVAGTIALLISAIVWLAARSRVRNALVRSELERVEAKSRAKSEFLSQMSHEIRTPMNAVMGLVDLVSMERGLPAPVSEKLQKIRDSSQYLLSLINDILDMSRIENEKLQIESESFSLCGVLDALEQMMGAQAQQKQQVFSCTRRITHSGLVGDPVRLRQVLTNLLSNAIKFTPPGGKVSLQAEELSCEETTAELRFTVEDSGVGIAPEDRERIFRPFEQVGASSSKSAGTGLGLPISSSIVGAMGGVLELVSAPGQGTRFFFTVRLPLGDEPQAPAPAAPGREDLQGIRILLAEDNDLNAEIAQELLEMQGATVRRAENGRIAVELYRDGAGSYDAILMDIRMPEMDGLTATREIRASGCADSAVIPIIAMTANSFKEDEEAAAAAGMTGFVPKPVDSQLLGRVLRENLP